MHIFSMMITGMAIYNPVKSALTVSTGDFVPLFTVLRPLRDDRRWFFCRFTAFARFDDAKMSPGDKASLLTSKLTFVAMNMLAMCGALYKMSLMGLLPNTPSDWISFLTIPPNVQFSSGSQL